MPERITVHAYGFMDKQIPERIGLCPVAETPHMAYERIRSNIEHFGGKVTNVRRTYPLGDAPINAVEIQWEARGIWHAVFTAGPDEWAAKPASPAPTTNGAS